MSFIGGDAARRSSAVHAAVTALLVALVLLPALARAGQRLSVGAVHAGDAQGFHKSIDFTPDPPQLAADTSAVYLEVLPPADSAPAPVGEGGTRPLSPEVVAGDPLRAPPTAVSA